MIKPMLNNMNKKTHEIPQLISLKIIIIKKRGKSVKNKKGKKKKKHPLRKAVPLSRVQVIDARKCLLALIGREKFMADRRERR